MKKYSHSTMTTFSNGISFYLILFLTSLSVYMSIFGGEEDKVFANSPSFPIQNIIDDLSDWNFIRNILIGNPIK